MLSLTRLFQNLFDDKIISIAALLNFSSDAIQRLKVNNPGGVFNTLITETETKHQKLKDTVNTVGMDESQKEGRTIEMNTVLSDFKRRVSDVEGLIAYTFRNNPGIYQEFYPRGLTEYSRMSVEESEVLIKRFATAVQNHSSVLPTEEVDGFEKLSLDFEEARKNQQKEKGEVAGARVERDLAKNALQLQWTKNTLTIAAHFVGQAMMAPVYFDQNLLVTSNGKSHKLIDGSVDGNAVALISTGNITITNTTILTLRNMSGTSTLEFAYVENTESEPVLKISLSPNEERTITAAEIGFDSHRTVLIVKNKDAFAANFELIIPE